MDRWKNTLFFFVLCLIWGCHSVKAQDTPAPSNTSSTTEEIIPIYFSEIYSFKNLQYEEQNKLIRSKLLSEGLISSNVSEEETRELANGVVTYILKHQGSKDKITELSRLLLSPKGEYGSDEKDDLLEVQKMSIIHDWLQQVILGVPMLDWVLNAIQNANRSLELNRLLIHEYLRLQFMAQINTRTKLGLLTSKTRKYYTDNLLSRSMPSFIYQPRDSNDLKNLQMMNISEAAFGHLHAGLKVLKDAEDTVDIRDLKMDEIIDIGIYFESFYQENDLANSDHFELPSKVYCLSLLGYMVPRADWGLCADSYFKYLKESNKFIKLGKLLESKKTRPQLAREELKKHDVSEDNLKSYLYAGDSEKELENSKGQNVMLPSPDGIFKKHLKIISDASTELGKLILPISFDASDDSDRTFIENSKVNLIDFVFENYNIVGCSKCFPMHRLTKEKLPRAVNIIQCLHKNQSQRLYALKIGNYSLHRVDNGDKRINKMAVIKLLEPGTYDHAIESDSFKMTEISSTLLKEQDEGLRVMTNELAKIQGEWLFRDLWHLGYEATFWQKVGDFAKSIIPFYTCLNEPKYEEGFSNTRAMSCAMDTISFVPLVGQVGYKLGSAALRASATTLQSAARQVTILQAIRNSGLKIATQVVPAVQKAVPAKAYINLGKEFLRSVDPGIGLLRLGGKTAVNVIKGTSIGLKKLIPGLSRLVSSLEKQTFKYQRLIKEDVLKTMTVKKLPYSSKEISVVRIGKQKGKDIYVGIDPETNVMFGRKYILNSKTGDLEYAPVTLREKIYQLRITGLNGDPVEAGRVYAIGNLRKLEREVVNGIAEYGDHFMVSRKAYEEADVVYRVDVRSPEEILKAEGFFPRGINSKTINNDMLQYSALLEGTNIEQNVVTPFVSTSSNLDNIMEHLRGPYLDRWIELARPRRIPEIQSRIQQINSGVDIGSQAINKIKAQMLATQTVLLHNPPDAYIYAIKPDHTFYHRSSSYLFSADVMPPGAVRNLRYQTAWDLSDKHEFLALRGINEKRIISWTRIYKNQLAPPPVETWEKNSRYNILLDAKDGNNKDLYKTNPNVYTHVGITTDEEARHIGINLVQLVVRDTKQIVTEGVDPVKLRKIAQSSHYVTDEDIFGYVETGQFSSVLQ